MKRILGVAWAISWTLAACGGGAGGTDPGGDPGADVPLPDAVQGDQPGDSARPDVPDLFPGEDEGTDPVGDEGEDPSSPDVPVDSPTEVPADGGIDPADLPADLSGDDGAGPEDTPPACQPADCDDGDPCTLDVCQGGTCRHTPVPGCRPETCGNGVDDNGDLRIDCDDPQCDAEPGCRELPAGDVCRNALPVHDGRPVTAEMAGRTLSYRHDTTGMGDHYQPDCVLQTGGPDAAWHLVLGSPMRVLVQADFDGDDPDGSPGAVLMLYRDGCRPDQRLDCAVGGDAEAVLAWPLPPGDYLYVVDSMTAPAAPGGPYGITFTFEAPPATESLCNDRQDDDLDGETDCLDQDCQGDAACQGCAVEAVLSCGDTVHGRLTSAGDADWYSFQVSQPTNVAVYFGPEPGGTDYFNVNFKLGEPGRSCDEFLLVGGVTIWHTTDPQGAGFRARANQDYRVLLDATVFQTGAYRLQFLCGTEPESACGDGNDNDADAFVDCEDEDCFRNSACTGGHDAESCADPVPMGGPGPISLAGVGTEGLHWTGYVSTAGMRDDLSASCAPLSAGGPDATFSFSLADRIAVGISAESREFLEETPALYVMRAPCGPGSLVGCGEALLGLAHWSAVLDPGSYVVVVDAGSRGPDGRGEPVTVQLDAWFEAAGTPEDCDDGVDQDEDGLTDCQDPGCFQDVACTGGRSGEDCTDAFWLNGGQGLAVGVPVIFHNTTRGRRNDLSLSCSSWSLAGADTAHAFVLGAAATVTARALAPDGSTPAIAIFGPGCGASEEQACAVGTDSFLATQVSATLDPGTWYLVVDAGDGFLSRPWDADYTLEVLAEAL